MARIRTIKPEYAKDEILYDLESKTNLPLRVAKLCFPMTCDKNGRFEWRPRQLKLDILPYDDVEFDQILNELAAAGYIKHYQVDQKEYGVFVNFDTEQYRNTREGDSKIPDISEGYEIRHTSMTKTQRKYDDKHTNVVSEYGQWTMDNGYIDNGLSKFTNVNLLSTCQSTVQNFDNFSENSSIESPTTKQYKKDAKEVLKFLNEKTGRFFRDTDANINPIIARLKSGITASHLRMIIAKKYREWHTDETMVKFLRPATLFNKTKCEQYFGELHLKHATESTENEEMHGMQ